MKTEAVWAGEFGNAYLERNYVNFRERIPFWRMIMEKTGARSVFEFGCNSGWNLSAIERVDPATQMMGYDINEAALDRAAVAGVPVTDYIEEGLDAELTFTAGVLIHISPEDLQETMQLMIDLSVKYVLAIEYESDEEKEIVYRGQSGLLWKRPYGQLYQDMGLKIIGTGPAVEFDDATWFLFEK